MKKFFIVMILALMIPNICGATEIQATDYKGDFQFVYPEVKIANRFINTKINEKIREEVKELFHTVKQPDVSTTATMTYEISCDDKNILSLILTEVVYVQGAAHPSTYKRALNFDTRTGKLIKPSDLKNISREYAKDDYTPKGITKKLKAYAKSNGISLNGDFKEFEKMPENFYFDENFHLHFIFQQSELAPYAAGIIDFDATKY